MPRGRMCWCVTFALAAIGTALGWFVFRASPGDARLAEFVHHRPPVPIVFTSRTEPASFVAAAPEGEGFVYPGQPLWQAREGRLRLLTPQGAVHELTWQKKLPDGTTLIDVMSPSISLDGKKIVFAARKNEPAARFRLYEIDVDGAGLRQLTGGHADEGCIALPPMRFADSSRQRLLPEAERRRHDYDDVDPVYLNFSDGRICFVSSRLPDLGRQHARRSTTLWMMKGDGSDKRPLTANRNNDRWPFLTTNRYIAFSLWSRNREVLDADGCAVRPFDEELPSATAPTDVWMGAFVQAIGSLFGPMVKTPMPVWRPRPLFNGKIAFMTVGKEGLVIAQADPGLIANAPSSLPRGTMLPATPGHHLIFGPKVDERGKSLNLATPGPCPPGHLVLSGGPTDGPAGGYGLYLARDSWNAGLQRKLLPADIGLRVLFDDPDFVDAEPVAVYSRPIGSFDNVTETVTLAGSKKEGHVRLADGSPYHGLAGQLFNNALYNRHAGGLPGQQTDVGEGPIFEPPPQDSIHSIAIYASRRDRFDDPQAPRIAGDWQLLVKLPVNNSTFGGWIPAGVPTVLAGLDKDGKVVRWSSRAQDSQGRSASFYALAGDHYSAVRPGGQHFCIGCHPGHSGPSRIDHKHAERIR